MALPSLRCNLLRMASLVVLLAMAGLVQGQEPGAEGILPRRQFRRSPKICATP